VYRLYRALFRCAPIPQKLFASGNTIVRASPRGAITA
jgi:hypothetical protein